MKSLMIAYLAIGLVALNQYERAERAEKREKQYKEIIVQQNVALANGTEGLKRLMKATDEFFVAKEGLTE